LWDLQPWLLLFFPALIWVLWLLVKDGLRLKHLPEGFSVSGFVLMLVVLSASRYKLPHYVFPLFPFAAIIVAHFLYTLQEAKPALLQRVGNWFLAFQVSFILAAMAVATYLFPLKEWWAWMLIIGMGFLAYHFRKTLQGVEAIVFPVIFIAGITGMVMATAFYPALMAYQSTNTAGRWAQVHAPDADGFYFFSKGGHSLDFYAQRTVPQIFDHQLDTLQQETFIYTGVAGLAHFRSNYDGKFEVVWEAPDFTVSRLNFSFLLPNQRDQAVKAAYIMRWQPEETVH
jgi:4-amino-4-deoxy-L-arabinose transferase-like glycosyltransferase